MLYNAWDKAIKLCDDYSTIASEAKHKAVYGERIKILTPNQMLQSLPIVTATGLEPTTT